jgi:calcineurin-like phosphoesterase family protein
VNQQITIDHTHHFVADTHFGHVGILDMAMRPYREIGEHDRDLVTKWNSIVRPTDTVWHLGDFAGEDVPIDQVAAVFKKLNGTKRLIVGNHDGHQVCNELDWASVDTMRTVVADGAKIVLCHYPLREWQGFHGGDIHFHGHTHDRLPSSRRTWDCGVDHQSFLPMTYQQIRNRMGALPELDFAGVERP